MKTQTHKEKGKENYENLTNYKFYKARGAKL